jgi:hypothetical protein
MKSAKAGGTSSDAAGWNKPPSYRNRIPNLASQTRVACSSIAWNTGFRSPGELEMTRRTSDVAASCSSASSRSRFRRSNCSVESADTCVIGALVALGLVVRCPFPGCPLSLRRCMSPPGGSRRCSILGRSSLSRHGRMSALPPKEGVDRQFWNVH